MLVRLVEEAEAHVEEGGGRRVELQEQLEAAAEGGARADCAAGCGGRGRGGRWRDAGGGEAVDFPEEDFILFGGAGEDEVVVESEAGEISV